MGSQSAGLRARQGPERGHAGRRHQEIHATQLGHRLLDEGVDGLGGGHVGGHGERAAAALAHPGRDVGQLAPRAGGEDHRRALVGEGLRHRAADAPAGARDDGRLPVERLRRHI